MSFETNSGFTLSKQLATWPNAHPCFWLQMRVGILSHILQAFATAKNGGVQSFFQGHYGNKTDPLVFDGNSDGYLSQLNSLICPRHTMISVIDLGCGNGALYSFLEKNNFDVPKYIGLDFAIKTKTLCAKASIREIDLTSAETLQLLDFQNTLFAINTFCYIENLIKIPILSDARKKRDDTLLVLEPWPGWFWDRHFEGIWPKYRLPHELIASLSKIGWVPTSQINFYFFNMFGQFFWPLSYALSFKKHFK